MGACTGADDELGPVEDAEAVVEEEVVEATTRLMGRMLDTDEEPVAGAEVVLVIGSVPASEPTRTDENGAYALDVPTDRVVAAWNAAQEVTVVFNSPQDDRAPFGTAEGDLVHMMPASLDELVSIEDIVDGARIETKTTFVPRQGKGFAITDELIANGGELTWVSDDSQYGKDFRVTLIIEPGSIHEGEDAQDEITLTLIEQAKAPMAIPEDGFGPLWTIQPRNVVFDPPARIRIEGDRFPVLGDSALVEGDRTELFGASLETGWKLFGEIELADEVDGRVTLETPEGVIAHGAWGHVFSNTDSDYGMLVECFSRSAYIADGSNVRVQCAVLNDIAHWYFETDPVNGNHWVVTNLCDDPNFVPPPGVGGGYDNAFLACQQWDYGTSTYDGHHMVYATDAETRCRGCGGTDVAPYALAMSAADTLGESTDPVYGAVTAFPLCPEDTTITDMDVLWNDVLYPRIGLAFADGTALPYESADIAGEVDAALSWRNFSKSVQIYVPDPVGCAG